MRFADAISDCQPADLDTNPQPFSGAATAAAGGIVEQVAELVRERDELARRVAVLDAKLVEVTDLWEAERGTVRAAYRRGYFAGRTSARRGAPAVDDPERRARGWMREVLAA